MTRARLRRLKTMTFDPKVIQMPKAKPEADELLEASKDDLKHVILVGFTKDGHQVVRSTLDVFETAFWLEDAKDMMKASVRDGMEDDSIH